MNVQSKRMELLSLMPVKTDTLGNLIALQAGFYDFQLELNMDKVDYEELLKSLYQEGMLSISMDNPDNFNRAIISITQTGYEYREAEVKQSIGFHVKN